MVFIYMVVRKLIPTEQIIPNSSTARLSQRLVQPVCRQFGTTLRSNGGHLDDRSPFLFKRPPGTTFLSSATLASIGQVRYNSTQPSSAPGIAPVAAPPTTPDPVSASMMPASTDPGVTEISVLELSGSDLLNMPENIGFLKTMGLDFGWGPTSMMQWFVEHLYVYSGLPWWATIIMTAVLVRLTMLPLSIHSTTLSQKIHTLRMNPQYAAAYKRYTEAALLTKDQLEMVLARQELKGIERAEGIRNKYMAVVVPLLQVVPSYGMFRICRAMADLPVPSWETGGLLWFTDLTLADPFFLLPMLNAVLMYMGNKVRCRP